MKCKKEYLLATKMQQGWDKQRNFLQAQARAQKTPESMISKYEDLLHKNWELATVSDIFLCPRSWNPVPCSYGRKHKPFPKQRKHS